MNKVKFVLFAAGISLALVFIFSCSSDDIGGGDKSSSSNGGGNGIVYGDTVYYGNETYLTVVIGNQTWMARNLNYNASGSRCYNDDPANCKQYGRLYDWATAMGIGIRYNSEKWGGNYEKHRGICPSGWHIPSNTDWWELLNYVGNGNYKAAGRYLNAKKGWNDYKGESCNGEDKYGFSALPGGNFDALPGSSGFINGGDNGLWWYPGERDSSAYYWYIGCAGTIGSGDSRKSNLNSVRCLKD